MKKGKFLLANLILLVTYFRLSNCFQAILDFSQVEQSVQETKLNAIVLISQYNNCPKCLNAERMIKQLDKIGRYYMSFFILHCDMIPKDMLRNNFTETIMHKLIHKTCFKQQTMIRPELYIFSPIDLLLEQNVNASLPIRYSRFIGNFIFDEIKDFIFIYQNTHSEEVRNLNQMNFILAENKMPTFVQFSDGSKPSIILSGFSSYFRKKIKFVWIPKTLTQIRKNFLKNPNDLPSYHLIVQGRVFNLTNSSNFGTFLNFIELNTKIKLPNPSHVKQLDTYQFFSDFCNDCNALYKDTEYYQNVKQKNKFNIIPEPFWKYASMNQQSPSQLITELALKQSSDNNQQGAKQQEQNNNTQTKSNSKKNNESQSEFNVKKEIKSDWIKDSFFNQIKEINDDKCEDENIFPKIDFRDYQSYEQNVNKSINNTLTLFKGFELFDKWEDLKKSLQTKQNIFKFKEIDCESKECVIWARNTYNTLYIPFVIFESPYTGIKPLLIQNNLEIIQIHNLIQDYVFLNQSQVIQERSNDDARQFCNDAFSKNYLCTFQFGKNVSLLFKILSQQEFSYTHFIHVQQPSQQLINKLNTVNNTIIIVDNKSHLQGLTLNHPYQPNTQFYINILLKQQKYVQYSYYKLSSLDQIKNSKSQVQVIVQCQEQHICKNILNVIKQALKIIHYLDYSTIYFDTEGIFIFEQWEQQKTAYLVINQQYYTPFTVEQYNLTKNLHINSQLVVGQLIQIFNYYHNFAKLD